MKIFFFLIITGLMLVNNAMAEDGLLWDDVVMVQAARSPNGKWYYCPDDSTELDRILSDEFHCFSTILKIRSDATETTLQGIIDKFIVPAVGHPISLVGFFPAFIVRNPSGKVVSPIKVSSDVYWFAYKLR